MIRRFFDRLAKMPIVLFNATQREIPVGGQAVIEGVLMRGPRRWALAVRDSNQQIQKEQWPLRPWASRRPWSLPVFRGMATMAEMLVVGMKALSRSASIALGEEESVGFWEIAVTFVVAIVAVVGLFIALPVWVSDMGHRFLGGGAVVKNLFEGIARAAVFVGYVAVIGLWGDIRRVFAYHGAEHKTINAWEAGADLDPASVSAFSRIHTRCGTSFLLVVVAVSVVVFAIAGEGGILWRIGTRVLLLPLVIGVSYEIIKACSKSKGFGRYVMKPALWLQYLTTREPDLEQIEVAVVSLRLALGEAYLSE